ncbi:MAG: hypothetical protein KJ597_02215 [Nanoarchaeota archaeon]|nr:hypothetical protein [Nanoarchaeota archaeon]MBU1622366.1 hypothetical protein [Nanoarchaeota archaeon]
MILKHCSKKSIIKIHNPNSWVNFLNSRNSDQNLEGTYLPRTLTAHLKEETPFLEINRFHEYDGHGSFCEFSRLGKKIVKYERELGEIEKQILGTNQLTGNHHFQLTRDNPFFEQYDLLRKEFDEFLKNHHNYYEGFAYWLEKYLSLESGLTELYQQREKVIITPFYLELVASFEQFVRENSIDALLDKMQFE